MDEKVSATKFLNMVEEELAITVAEPRKKKEKGAAKDKTYIKALPEAVSDFLEEEAKAVKEATGLGHKHSRVHPLTGDIGDTEGNLAGTQGKEIVEVARHLLGRDVDAYQPILVGLFTRQQAALNFACSHPRRAARRRS